MCLAHVLHALWRSGEEWRYRAGDGSRLYRSLPFCIAEHLYAQRVEWKGRAGVQAGACVLIQHHLPPVRVNVHRVDGAAVPKLNPLTSMFIVLTLRRNTLLGKATSCSTVPSL